MDQNIRTESWTRYQQKENNYSSRSTIVSHMAHAGIQEQQLIKIMVHSNTSSLKPHMEINEEHHSAIVNKLRNLPSTSTSTSSNSHTSVASKENTVPASFNFQNCVFNNCTFK
ncbi:hypothetical protein C0J52_22783 [Blattella germanica]|nr:hypothetical protein C0J52_22783 [Blattella germanica]